MHLYISQLLEDLRSAHRAEAKIAIVIDSVEAHIEEVERYISGDYEQLIGDVLGLTKEQFPPVQMLSEEQMKSVVEAFSGLLESYHIRTDLPPELPIAKTYALIVSVLNRKVYLADGGFVTIEFCSYAPWNCQLGEWCMCKDLTM